MYTFFNTINTHYRNLSVYLWMLYFCRQSSAFGLVRNEHPTAEESHLHAGDELPAGLPPGGTRRSQRGIHADVAEFLQGMGKGIVRGAVHLHTFLYFAFVPFALLLSLRNYFLHVLYHTRQQCL